MTGVFEGVGSLQFSPDNKFAYAYSGAVSGDDTEFILLTFKTNSEYLVGSWRVGYSDSTYRNFDFRLLFNDIEIEQLFLLTSSINDVGSKDNIIVIPPFTTIKILAANTEDSTTQTVNAIVTAKVKGAIQQENLESITNNNKWASK